MSSSSNNNAHILMIPFPASGHILPHIDLTHQLAIRGLKITMLVTPKNLHYLSPLLSLHPTIETLVLPFPFNPSIPTGVENLQDVTVEYVSKIATSLSELHGDIVQWFQTHPSPPVAIICDELLDFWTHQFVPTLGVKVIAFTPVNANSLYSFWSKDVSVKGELFAKNHVKDKEAWGIIFNSSPTIEGLKKFDAVKEEMTHKRVWGVAPLIPIKAGIERGGPSSISTSDVIAWLDSCNIDKSVMYVGFGSQITLNKLQMEALADALEKSGVKFIWAVKDPVEVVKDDQSVVPVGFEDRVAGRGLVIRGWAPQAMILKHRVVGSYLTHCGWGSVLEAILGEVLLLAWPMQIDHFFNTELFVDEMGVAIRVCEGLGTIPNSTKLAQVFRESLSETRPERVSFLKLCAEALNAIKEGGSSYKALDDLASEISN